MATVIRENIAPLHDKLTVNITKEDYLPTFDKNLKEYAKKANIPGFRKGMVPAGLIKKMYGQNLFNEDILKNVEKHLGNYLTTEKLDIFAQPLPLNNNISSMDMNSTKDYSFSFDVGLKPNFTVDLAAITPIKYVVDVTDTMIDEEVARLQTRFGNMTEPETISNDEQVLNVTFTEVDEEGNVPENGINKPNSLIVKYFHPNFRPQLMGLKKDDVVDVHIATAFEDKERAAVLEDLGLDKNEAASADRTFKMTITKIGFVEAANLDETFFAAAYPAKEIKTIEDFRATVKEDISAYYASQSRNQIFDQIYHGLVDNTSIDFPATFLKRWLQVGTEKMRSAEEAEVEYPNFCKQLTWTLVSTKLQEEEKVEVLPNDIKDFAKAQLFQYMGGQMDMMGENNQWIDDYANRMLQDKKFVEDAYQRISTEKLFAALENRVSTKDESISVEAFAEKVKPHNH